MASATRLRPLVQAPRLRWQTESCASSAVLFRSVQASLSPRSRQFSAGRPCLRKNESETLQTKVPPQRSVAVEMEKQRQTLVLPDDVGLMPGTFIMPTGANLPSLFSDFKGRWMLERTRIKQHTVDLVALLVIKFWYVRDPSRKTLLSKSKRFSSWFQFPRLDRFAIPGVAKKLYEDMYTHFAAGTIYQMRPRLCENIAHSLEGRVANRPKNTVMRWKLVRYIGSPKVVSHRYVPMSLDGEKGKHDTLQQAVVRIKSVQSLQRLKKVRIDGKTREVLDEGSVGDEGREVQENFVVQRTTRKGKAGEWKVWGTTEETTLDKIMAEERQRLGL